MLEAITVVIAAIGVLGSTGLVVFKAGSLTRAIESLAGEVGTLRIDLRNLLEGHQDLAERVSRIEGRDYTPTQTGKRR